MATEVLVPPLGQTVDTVALVSWYRQEGEAITQGEMLYAIETDKATLDVEAPASGVLCRVTARPGDEVKVLSAIALIAAPGEVLEEASSVPSPEPAFHTGDPVLNPGQATEQVQAQGAGHRIFVSPRARRLAGKHGIPLTALTPTGPEGAIIERDVRAYLDVRTAPTMTPVARRVAKGAELEPGTLPSCGPSGRIMQQDVARAAFGAAPAAEQALETIPVRGVRAVVAERMLHSATTTAGVTLNAEVDATALVTLRRQLVQDGPDVSYSDLLLYILGRALRDHPRLNASLQGEVIHVWKRIDVGLAVDAEGGLLVPVVRDVDRKGLGQLAKETRALAERARVGRCTPEELSGGTFTLTNLGMFDIDSFTPIVNLPECAILGVGRIKTQPAVVGEQVVARQMMWLSLTFDHRLVDGAPAARFLQRVVQLIEHPHLLLS